MLIPAPNSTGGPHYPASQDSGLWKTGPVGQFNEQGGLQVPTTGGDLELCAACLNTQGFMLSLVFEFS